MIAMGFSSGYGMYPEELLPYSEWNNGYSESLRYYSDYRFKDFNVYDKDNKELVKQKLMENGALVVSYNCFYSNYNEVDGWEAYYDYGVPLDGNYNLGHLAAIVGWDDNFSKEYFHSECILKITERGSVKTVGEKKKVVPKRVTKDISGCHMKLI